MYQDTYSSFHEFISAHGYTPKGEIQAGRFIRMGKNQSVSAKLYEDGSGGFLHDWKTGEKHYWFAKGKHYDRFEQERKIKAHQQAEELKYREAGKQAETRYKQAKPANPQNPYLVKKQVKPYDLKEEGDLLILPVCSVQGDFQSLQLINPQGEKKFLSGGKMKGGCHFIGLLKKEEPVYIAEGFATGASIHEETQSLTVVAFNAGNLIPVAQDLRKHLPDIEIIIAGDTDDTGRKFAELASQSIHGTVIYPPFQDPTQGTDWNDYLTMGVSL
jgi:putative DNA primase/helicase